MTIMIRKNLIITIAVVILCVAFAQAVFAGAQTYVDKRHVINAGVLVPRIPGGGMAEPAAPYIFYILGLRDDLKPHGWTFVNPLAGADNAFKNTAGYWKVLLDKTTVENLSKFDILYMSANTAVGFPMADRDKLRRFVDGGGCLWVDNGGGMTFPTGSGDEFFISGVNFLLGSGGNPMIVQTLHPLVTTPFRLSPVELASLSSNNYVINPGYESSFGTSPPSPNSLAPILVNVTNLGVEQPTIASIEYGSGRVVFTSGFVGGKIQGPVVGLTPDTVLTPNIPVMAAAPANVRFAYNVVNYATSYTSFRKEYRRTGCSSEGLGAPLVNIWNFPNATNSGNVENSAVIWKGIIYCTSGNMIYALDANPEIDLDMDGFADDGIVDGPGSGYDLLWSYSCSGRISSPTVATMLDPYGGNIEQKDFVLVTCQNGQVYIFEALSRDSNGLISKDPVLRSDLWSGNIGEGNGELLAPVVQHGWIYVAGRDGKIWGHCPVLAAGGGGWSGSPTTPWSVPLVVSTDESVQATIKAGPTLAFIKNQANGALVHNLSVIAKPPSIGSSTKTINDHIYSLPVYVSSDPLRPTNARMLARGTATSATYRISYGTLPIATYPEPEVWAVDNLGNIIPVDFEYNYNNSPGLVYVSVKSGFLGPTTKVYMSYALDYSRVGTSMNFTTPNYELPPRQNDLDLPLVAETTPAVGPKDNYYLGVNWPSSDDGSACSSVYSVWFDGNKNSSRLRWNYLLHGGGMLLNPSADTLEGNELVSLDAADPTRLWGIHAKDPTGNIHPVARLEVKSTPAVSEDRVFVTASTRNPGNTNLSRGYLICLKAYPEFSIRLNRPLKDPNRNNRNYEVSIWQPDFLFPEGTQQQPPAYAARRVPASMINYDTGTITISNFGRDEIRLQGTTAGGQTSTLLTPSLPVWVFLDRQPVPLDTIDFSAWDNLLWAMAVPYHGTAPCSGGTSSPIILGGYVYFTCDDGYLFAVPVDAMPEDNKTKILDPKKSCEMNMPIDSARSVKCSTKTSLSGGNGMLVVPTDSGLYLFKNEMHLVTDNRRVMEIGSDGKVAWSCDSVIEPTPLSGIGGNTLYGVSSSTLSKPLVAQKLGGSDYLIVDSGNDRILRIDRGGQVTWSCSQFVDTYRNVLKSGESRKLKSPSDAIMWSEYERVGNEWFYVIHCLVADSGNFRIVDIVDRFIANEKMQILGPVNPDPNGKPIHELNWVSRTTSKDKKFTYNSLKLIRGLVRSGAGAQEVNQIWASLSNYGLGAGYDPILLESTGGGQLGGAIVAMKYRENVGDFEWNYLDGGELTGQLTTLNNGGNKIELSGPTYFDVLDPTIPKLLICDSSAVYVTEGQTGDIRWMLTALQYANLMRNITESMSGNRLSNVTVPIPFSPYRAQVLPGNNRILVVNSYAGSMNDSLRSKFSGEIFEVDYNEGTPPGYIQWYIPDIWVEPSGTYIQKLKNSSSLDQPTCVQRLF